MAAAAGPLGVWLPVWNPHSQRFIQAHRNLPFVPSAGGWRPDCQSGHLLPAAGPALGGCRQLPCRFGQVSCLSACLVPVPMGPGVEAGILCGVLRRVAVSPACCAPKGTHTRHLHRALGVQAHHVGRRCSLWPSVEAAPLAAAYAGHPPFRGQGLLLELGCCRHPAGSALDRLTVPPACLALS